MNITFQPSSIQKDSITDHEMVPNGKYEKRTFYSLELDFNFGTFLCVIDLPFSTKKE